MSDIGVLEGAVWENFPETRSTPPPRSIGIIGLGEFREIIYDLQSLRGKILSHKELRDSPGV